MNKMKELIIDQTAEKQLKEIPSGVAGGDLSGLYPNPKVRFGRSVYTGAPSTGSGVLVETDIITSEAEQVFGEIRGNTNSGNLTLFTTFQFYNKAEAIVAGNACNYGSSFGDISVFVYNSKVYLWLPDIGYRSVSVSVKSVETERVATIKTGVIPSGITKRINITPVDVIRQDTTASGALTGTFKNPSLSNNSVQTNNVANNAISALKLAPHASWSVTERYSSIITGNTSLSSLYSYNYETGIFTSPGIVLLGTTTSHTINMSMPSSNLECMHIGYLFLTNGANFDKTVIFTPSINTIYRKVIPAGKSITVLFAPQSDNYFVILSVFDE